MRVCNAQSLFPGLYPDDKPYGVHLTVARMRHRRTIKMPATSISPASGQIPIIVKY